MKSRELNGEVWTGRERRKFPRLNIRCRARIHIGGRHYAGYIDNICRNGAKLTTLVPIRDSGAVILVLPDLEPIYGQLQWISDDEAGARFDQELSASTLSIWAHGRRALPWLRKREAEESVAA